MKKSILIGVSITSDSIIESSDEAKKDNYFRIIEHYEKGAIEKARSNVSY